VTNITMLSGRWGKKSEFQKMYIYRVSGVAPDSATLGEPFLNPSMLPSEFGDE